MTNTWQAGHNDSLGWLQYGDFDAKTAQITFIRRAFVQRVELRVHALQQLGIEREPAPRHVAFSLETGTGAEHVSVDGVGFIVPDSAGSTLFTTGDSTFDEDLTAFQRWAAALKETLTVRMEGKALTVPVDDQARQVLPILFAHKQPG